MKRKVVQAFLLLMCMALIASAATARSAVRHMVQIHADDTSEMVRLLERENFDVVGQNREKGTVCVGVSVSGMRRLKAMGLEPWIVSGPGQEIPPGYKDFDAVMAALRAFADGYPAIARNVDVGAEFGVGSTWEGRPLRALKISDNVSADEDEPALLIVSGHHAREIVTPVLALRIIETLLEGYGRDDAITRIVDGNEIWIAPVWNPDGYAHVFETDSYWRRNRSPIRFGFHGVDLNRNYPFGWNGPVGGSTDPTVETYRGRFAASENETQNMLAFAADRSFAKVLDFHSHGREVLYTYHDPFSMPLPLEKWYMWEATQLSFQMGYGGRIRKPSAEGEHYQWQLNEHGAYSFLAETASSFHPTHGEALDEADRIWPGVRWFLERPIPLKGHVTETATGNPIEADIEVAGFVYPAGDRRRSNGATGRFHYFVPPGVHAVTFSAPGYAPRTVEIAVGEGDSTIIETQLGAGPALSVSGKVSPGETMAISFDYPAGAGQHYVNGISSSDRGFLFPNGLFFPIGNGQGITLGASLFPGWTGTLDRSGHAGGILHIPDDPELVGQTFHMAYYTYTTAWFVPCAVSGRVTLTVEQ